MTLASLHMMQPYPHNSIKDPNMFARGSPDLTLSPGMGSVDSLGKPFFNRHKRTGLEPPEEDDRAAKKARRSDGSASMADSVFFNSCSQPPMLPPLGRASMFGSQLPDAAFARYMAEKQNAALTGFYPGATSPLLPPTPMSGGFDIGGMPAPPLGMGMGMNRPQFFDPLSFCSPTQAGPLGCGFGSTGQTANAGNPFMSTGAMSFGAMPMQMQRQMQMTNQLTNMPPRRTSQTMVPRRVSQTSHSVNNQEDVPLPRMSSGCGDEHHAHFSNRVCIDVSIDQDPNWLSELQCYVRKNLLEVCWASREDVAVRNASKKVSLDQVGIRCRYCAHKPPGSRAQRSSAFPSTIPQLYQSFTMMLRDHFDACTCIPEDTKARYLSLKSATCQGATEAKKYWSYSARRLGMVDSEEGIIMNETTRAAARSIPSFGHHSREVSVPLNQNGQPVLLVKNADHEIASGFLYTLLSHFHRIELLPSERKGNRKSLRLGLPGFGCRHCSKAGRFGMSRVFPARRRTLPVRIADLYDHICRCNLCPPDSKVILQRLREESQQDTAKEKQFLDLVWQRLGHDAANP